MSKAQAAVVTTDGIPPPAPRRLTRERVELWDRIKFLILLVLLWFVLVWSVMANDPIVGFLDAMRIEVRAGWWVFLLIGLEVLRQAHFIVSEHSPGYHRFWTVQKKNKTN